MVVWLLELNNLRPLMANLYKDSYKKPCLYLNFIIYNVKCAKKIRHVTRVAEVKLRYTVHKILRILV
jgi:hypothetical protein